MSVSRSFPLSSVRGAGRSQQSFLLLGDHILHLGCKVQPQRTLHDDQRLLVCEDLGSEHGEQAGGDVPGETGEQKLSNRVGVGLLTLL